MLSPVHPAAGPSEAFLENPFKQGHSATATPVVIVLSGHGRQEVTGSVAERYVPAGQAGGGQ